MVFPSRPAALARAMIRMSLAAGSSARWRRKYSLNRRFKRLRITELPTLALTVIPNRLSDRSFILVMMTKFAGVLVCKVGPQRQLARPLSAVQQQYLVALGVSATCFTLPTG